MNRLSRRALLGGLSLLPLAASPSAASVVTRLYRGRQAPMSAALIGPAATWKGAPLSGCGGVAPSEPATPSVKPVAHWAQAGEIVMLDDATVFVTADCWGLVDYVELGGDCATTRNSVQEIYVDPTGTVLKGWRFVLSRKAFTDVSTSGAVRLFATVKAADPSITDLRVIGNDSPAQTSVFKTDWRMTLYPRLAYDFDKGVGAGRDYADLTSAIAGARAWNGTGATTARIRCYDDGATYEAADIAGNTGTANALGLMTIEAAPGVNSVTISRAANYDPNTPSSWYWRPGWSNGIKFGSGIVIDNKNFLYIRCEKPCAFDGCKVTNSVADPTNNYALFNKTSRDGMNVWSDAHVLQPCWFKNCTVEYQSNLMSYSYMAVGVKGRYLSNSPLDHTAFLQSSYLTHCDIRQFNLVNQFTVQYSGAGAGTFQRVGNTITLSLNGTSTVFTCVAQPNLVDATHTFDATDLYSKINMIAGMSASGLVDSRFASSLLGGESAYSTAFDIKTAPVTLYASLGTHTELVHYRTDGTAGLPTDNVHLLDSVVLNANWTTSPYDFESSLYNVAVTGIVMDTQNQQHGVSGFAGGVLTAHHAFMQACQHDGIIGSGPGTADSYCHIDRCIINGVTNNTSSPTVWPNFPQWSNNLLTVLTFSGVPFTPTPANHPGNVILEQAPSTAAYLATWTNQAAGDARPAGAALTNLFTAHGWDGRGALFPALAPAGAWIAGGAAPSYPF